MAEIEVKQEPTDRKLLDGSLASGRPSTRRVSRKTSHVLMQSGVWSAFSSARDHRGSF